MKLLCGSLSGVNARRRAQGMADTLAKRDNAAVAPDRPRPKGLAGETSVFVASP